MQVPHRVSRGVVQIQIVRGLHMSLGGIVVYHLEHRESFGDCVEERDDSLVVEVFEIS